VLAWLLYCNGGGAGVTILLERALRSEPEYVLAQMLVTIMLSQIPPETVREITKSF
jgi:hypothetical protein